LWDGGKATSLLVANHFECRKEKEMLMELTQVGISETVRIMAIEGGRGLRQKLFLRGLIEGKMVRVVSNFGPVTVEIDRNIVAIGRGMAQKIIVSRN